MRLHEVLEQAAAALRVFHDVLFQRRYRHGAYVAYGEDRGELDAQGEPFDVAIELAREQERGLQCRFHEIMLLDRNENGLETHGDLPFVRTSPAARAAGRGFRRLAVSRRTAARAIGTPVALWPSHSRVSSTVSPSGNSSASWCTLGLSTLICRNRATFVPSLMCGRKAKKRS